jgi:hypothetical protein
MNPKVYTFFTEVKDLKLGKKPSQLVEYWKEDWSEKGWDPVVLGLEHAEAHPFFREFYNSIKKIKTTNPFAYESACLLRHLAMSAVGGGFMVDTDVFNLTLKGDDLPQSDSPLLLWGGHVPCALVASAQGYEYLCRAMAPYCTRFSSDMYIMSFFNIPHKGMCTEPPNTSGKIIHFAANKIGIDKLTYIKTFMQKLKNEMKT